MQTSGDGIISSSAHLDEILSGFVKLMVYHAFFNMIKGIVDFFIVFSKSTIDLHLEILIV